MKVCCPLTTVKDSALRMYEGGVVEQSTHRGHLNTAHQWRTVVVFSWQLMHKIAVRQFQILVLLPFLAVFFVWFVVGQFAWKQLCLCCFQKANHGAGTPAAETCKSPNTNGTLFVIEILTTYH